MDSKAKTTGIRAFILPLVFITAAFFVFDILVINVIKNHYYSIKKDEAEKLAKSYSRSLMTASEAQNIINRLLEEKILVASEITATYETAHNNEILHDLADELEVDEIYSYDKNGEITHSSNGRFIGWKAYEGHPVHDFMTSGEKSRVEEIRRDTETGIFYKYGYYKAENGSFVQIGVLADKIQDFLGEFEVGKLLDEIKSDKGVMDVHLLDEGFTIINSTDEKKIGRYIDDSKLKLAASDRKEHGHVKNMDGYRVYEVFTFTDLPGSEAYLLGVEYSLEDTDILVKRISLIGSAVLLVIYASIFYTMLITRKTDRKLLEAAYYDSLTGLPNQQHMQRFMDEEIGKHPEGRQAFILIDCINFRTINMSYGYGFGDETIIRLAEELKRITGPQDSLYRLSAARFAVHRQTYEDRGELVAFMGDIKNVFDTPVSTMGATHYLKTRTAIVEMSGEEGISDVYKNALIALNLAETDNEGDYVFFNSEMRKVIAREEAVENELREALEKGESEKLYMEYQPFFSLSTGKITGFEALARMKSDKYGEIPPMEFIDIAERNQLIIPLGKYLFKTACDFANRLKSVSMRKTAVAVNISGIQLMRDDFASCILKIMEESGVAEDDIILEITESILLENFDDINERLNLLQERNIRIALDDFGKGYSSFYRLQELNVDILKIDRCFINRIQKAQNGEFITAEIISIAHKLGLMAVAEGVETRVQMDYLKRNRCDIIQGYLLSRPIPEGKAIELLNKGK